MNNAINMWNINSHSECRGALYDIKKLGRCLQVGVHCSLLHLQKRQINDVKKCQVLYMIHHYSAEFHHNSAHQAARSAELGRHRHHTVKRHPLGLVLVLCVCSAFSVLCVRKI